METNYIVQRTQSASSAQELHRALVSHLLEGLTKTGIGTEGKAKLNRELSKERRLRGLGLFSLLK